jgi:hypothetical protein
LETTLDQISARETTHESQIFASEKAHEAAEVEEGLVEEAQGLVKPQTRTWSRELQLIH